MKAAMKSARKSAGLNALFAAMALLVASAVSTPTSAQTAGGADALAAELATRMASEEEHGHASFFPRKNVLALVTKSMWEIFYHSDASTAVQLDALAMLKNRVTTPIQKEAVERMQAEMTLN